MNGTLHAGIAMSGRRYGGLIGRTGFVVGALIFPLLTRAQTPFPNPGLARSVSDQFIVVGVPSSSVRPGLAARPEIATNAVFVRLEPALLAVSAERIKDSLRRELNPELPTPAPPPPAGKIYLVLHPAQSTNEMVAIVSQRSPGGWDYQVQLPDVLSRTRFLRAMTGVLLLESANRNSRDRAAEIPAWLTDGLSQELLAAAWQEIVLSAPNKTGNSLPVSRTVKTTSGVDSLAAARRVLRDQPALTFEQLSWPTEAQLLGHDGGAYRASAQLFVTELLALKNGPAHLRALLDNLPKFYNWQVAFQTAFRENFPRPLDVEKWWAVQVVNFLSRDPGPGWTPAVSRERLDEILRVPVEMRTASNSLPAHADISFQAVLRNFNRARQEAILLPKLRDLELAELRLAPLYAVLADGYRRALADYFGFGKRTRPASPLGKHPPLVPPRPTVGEILKRLDALDAQRRNLESPPKSDGKTP
jgi:hypothetical protein